MRWYLRACPACRGDLHDDIEDPEGVRCFMCGREFARAVVLGRASPAAPPAPR